VKEQGALGAPWGFW